MSTILVVEDELPLQNFVAQVLRKAGHTVLLAANGLEGISLYRSSPDAFSLILTDLTMPVMDGHQFIDLIRETNSNARIICMSGYTAKTLPPDVEFLKKPFLPDVLITRVNDALQQT